MTPQERQLVDELFDRLAKLEDTPRDPDAERAIADGLRVAPHAVYALVQTTLVQDEALKRASARIQELEGGEPQEQPRGFLDSMRDTLFGREERRGSVPTVRPGGQGSSGVWGSGQGGPPPPPGYAGGPPPGYAGGPPAVGTGGGSFLGTAAAAAAGVVGGSLLLSGIRNMMGGSHQGFGDAGALGDRAASPWSDQSNSSLARDAGIDDVGRGGADDKSNQGLLDQASYDDDRDNMMDSNADDFDDDGGDDGGGSDYA